MICFNSPDGKWRLKIRNSDGMPLKWFEPKWEDLKKFPPPSKYNYSTKEIIEAMKNIAPEAWNKKR